MQNWTELYKELAAKITGQLPEVRWVDLWHNQINFLEDEHPFPTPAVFLSFRSRNIEDLGFKVQKVQLQVDCFLYYETFLDTFEGAYNKDGALQFIETLDHLHALLHGTEGKQYYSMRRTAFAPVDTGNAGNLYQLSFECLLHDASARKHWGKGKIETTDVSADSDADSVTAFRQGVTEPSRSTQQPPVTEPVEVVEVTKDADELAQSIEDNPFKIPGHK